MLYRLDFRPGAAGESVCCGLGTQLLALGIENGGLVKRGGFTLYEADGVLRTVRQTVAEPVALIVTHELCLTVHQRKRAFLTGIDAQAAAGALSFIYMNDASFHDFLHFQL